MASASTDSTRCRPRCRRPASSASTTTDIRSTPAPSAVRSTSTPTPTASSSARTGGLSRSTRARSAAARSSTIPGITCRSWRASPAPCATARRSGTGCCRRRWTASSASSQAPTTATGSSSRFLAAVLSDGLPAVEAACAQALAENVHSADVVLNILARRRDPGPAPPIHTPAALSLRHAPVADCARYDTLTRLHQLGVCGEANTLESLRGESKGRHYRG